MNERGYISNNFSSYYHLYCLKVAKIPLTASREHIWRLLLFLPSDCDDSQTLPRLALRSHRILGLLRAFWFPPCWIGGRPPPPSRRPSYACQNQGGAGRRRSQEEGEESWVVLTLGSSKSASDSPPWRGFPHSCSRERGLFHVVIKRNPFYQRCFLYFSTGQ